MEQRVDIFAAPRIKGPWLITLLICVSTKKQYTVWVYAYTIIVLCLPGTSAECKPPFGNIARYIERWWIFFGGGQRQAQYREIKRVLTSCWRMIVGRISAYSRLWCYNAMQHPSHLPLQPNVEKCHRLLIWVYFTTCFHEQKYFSSQFLYFNTTRFNILHNDKKY